jgi:excisionase family DNA binding protein
MANTTAGSPAHEKPLAHSPRDAATQLGISTRSIFYLMKSGKLGYSRIGRRILIPHAELTRLLSRTHCKATTVVDADEPIRPRVEQGDGSRKEVEV